jgi:hypothetical protein
VSNLPIRSRVEWQLRDRSGALVASGETHNVVTKVGAQMYADRAVGIAGAPNAPTGFKLGTGSTAPAATGAGAALATYLSNSHQAFDGGFPSSAAEGNGRRITYRATFAAGKATSAVPITEAVIVNATLADSTSAESATVARALLAGIPTKAAGQTLTITWLHDLGA